MTGGCQKFQFAQMPEKPEKYTQVVDGKEGLEHSFDFIRKPWIQAQFFQIFLEDSELF